MKTQTVQTAVSVRPSYYLESVFLPLTTHQFLFWLVSLTTN